MTKPRKPLTRTQRRIAKKPISELRRVTIAERIAHPSMFSERGAYYVPKTTTKITKRTSFVTVTKRRDFLEGIGHTLAAAQRKAGIRGYKTAASRAKAREQIRTRRRFKRDWSDPNDVSGTHPFLNKAGDEQTATFKGRDLVIMQEYRTDWYGRLDNYGIKTRHGAIDTGDGFALRKYDRIKIFDVDGKRVRPDTDVRKLQRWWNGKSARQRNNFERELFYLRDRTAETRRAA
jgi:hypothetical protein